MLAVELLTAARAIRLRAPLQPSPAVRGVLDEMDAGVPGPDRFLAPEIQAAFDLITAGGAIGATGLDLN